jgi:vancomycin aglycone glucosyltransferase
MSATNDNSELWAQDRARFHDLFGAAVNAHRKLLGLAEISDVRSHMMTGQPWLAADTTLGPWPGATETNVFQTGAWILPNERPLSRDLDRFLEGGDPPIYFGFGSTRAPGEAGPVMLHAARALGRRAIISQGWFDNPLVQNERDCLSVGES